MEGGSPRSGGDSHLADGASRDYSGFGRTESGDIGRRSARSEKFLFPDLQRGFIAGRALLRMILASYCNCGPEDLCFSYGDYQKPGLKSNGHLSQTVAFNLSHSADAIQIAIGVEGPLGIDVEHLDARAGGSALGSSRQARDRAWTRRISRASSG